MLLRAAAHDHGTAVKNIQPVLIVRASLYARDFCVTSWSCVHVSVLLIHSLLLHRNRQNQGYTIEKATRRELQEVGSAFVKAFFLGGDEGRLSEGSRRRLERAAVADLDNRYGCAPLRAYRLSSASGPSCHGTHGLPPVGRLSFRFVRRQGQRALFVARDDDGEVGGCAGVEVAAFDGETLLASAPLALRSNLLVLCLASSALPPPAAATAAAAGDRCKHLNPLPPSAQPAPRRKASTGRVPSSARSSPTWRW